MSENDNSTNVHGAVHGNVGGSGNIVSGGTQNNSNSSQSKSLASQRPLFTEKELSHIKQNYPKIVTGSEKSVKENFPGMHIMAQLLFDDNIIKHQVLDKKEIDEVLGYTLGSDVRCGRIAAVNRADGMIEVYPTRHRIFFFLQDYLTKECPLYVGMAVSFAYNKENRNCYRAKCVKKIPDAPPESLDKIRQKRMRNVLSCLKFKPVYTLSTTGVQSYNVEDDEVSDVGGDEISDVTGDKGVDDVQANILKLKKTRFSNTSKKLKRRSNKKFNNLQNGIKLNVQFICKDCNRSFRSKQQLNKHKSSHVNSIKRFICKRCNKKFSQGPLLAKHMKKHEN